DLPDAGGGAHDCCTLAQTRTRCRPEHSLAYACPQSATRRTVLLGAAKTATASISRLIGQLRSGTEVHPQARLEYLVARSAIERRYADEQGRLRVPLEGRQALDVSGAQGAVSPRCSGRPARRKPRAT